MSDTEDGRSTRWRHRRSELLDAVVDCMCREGLADLSVREIARQIGVSAPTLLHHFDSKEALLASALVAVQADDLSQLSNAFAGCTAAEGLERLWSLQAAHGLRDRLRAMLEFQAIALRDPARFPSYHQNVTRPWVQVMHQALERSHCPTAQRIALATLLAGAYRGLLTDLLATGENKRIASGFEALLQTVREFEARWQKAGPG